MGAQDVSRGTNSKKVTAKRSGKDDLNLASSPARSSGGGWWSISHCFIFRISPEGARPSLRSVRPERFAAAESPPASARVCQFGQFSAVVVFVGARHASPSPWAWSDRFSSPTLLICFVWSMLMNQVGGVVLVPLLFVSRISMEESRPSLRPLSDVLSWSKPDDRRSLYRRVGPLG